MAKHDDRFRVGDFLLFKRNSKVYRIVATEAKHAKGSPYTLFTLRSLCGDYYRTNLKSRTLRREYICNDNLKILYGSAQDDIQLIKLQSIHAQRHVVSWVRRGINIAFKNSYVQQNGIYTIDTTPFSTTIVLPADDSGQPDKSNTNSGACGQV